MSKTDQIEFAEMGNGLLLKMGDRGASICKAYGDFYWVRCFSSTDEGLKDCFFQEGAFGEPMDIDNLDEQQYGDEVGFGWAASIYLWLVYGDQIPLEVPLDDQIEMRRWQPFLFDQVVEYADGTDALVGT